MADDPSAAVEPERRGACTPTDALPQMPCDRLGISDGIVNWQVYAVVSNKYFNVSLLSQSFAFTYSLAIRCTCRLIFLQESCFQKLPLIIFKRGLLVHCCIKHCDRSCLEMAPLLTYA